MELIYFGLCIDKKEEVKKMSDINPKRALVCIYKEDLFKNPEGNFGGTKLGSLVEAYGKQIDELDSAMDIPEPRRTSEEYRTIGGGRDVQQIAELGYEVAETTLELRWMTAVFIYYAMGKCTTSFVDSTEVITSHSSTAPSYSSLLDQTTITLETDLLAAITWDGNYRLLNDPDYTEDLDGDGSAQQVVNVTHRLPVTSVTSFTEDPLGAPTVLTRVALGIVPIQDEYSLNDRTGALIIGGTSVSGTGNYELIFTGTSDDFGIVSCPNDATVIVSGDAQVEFEEVSESLLIGHFLHTITGWELDDTLPFPSLGMHVEQAPGADDLKVDLLGVFVRSITISIEKDASAKISVDVICAYSKDASAWTKPAKATDEILKWTDIELTNTVWTYNATAMIGSSAPEFLAHTDSLEITIENDIDIEMVFSGEYPDKSMFGTRDYTVKMHVFPQDDKLREIRNLKTPTDPNNYGKTDWLAGFIALTVELSRDKENSTDYTKFVFDRLRITDYPDSIPDYDAKILGVDVEMKLAPGGSCIVTAEDDRNKSFFERT